MAISLVSTGQVAKHPDLALALAPREFGGQIGHLLIGVAALVSTASTINATLFSTALFAKRMTAGGLVPDQVAGSDTRKGGVPIRALVLIGVMSTAFTVWGGLHAITEFAPMAFIVVFGAMNYLSLRQRHLDEIQPWIPVVGLIGTGVFFPLFGWHLYTEQFGIFVLVVGIALALLTPEGLYFTRKFLRALIRTLERRI